MRKINLRGVIGFGLAAALLAPMTARAYSVQRSNSYMFVGGSDTIPIQVKLSTAASYTDGTSQSSTIIQALQQWNNVPGVPQFVPEILSPGTQATGNHLNEVVMAPTYDGDTFGPNILAVTLEVHAAKTARETDVIFNSAVTWDSYRGALTGGRAEIRRVAVHEFGHVLGLDHPDGAGQSVNAIMNSAIGQIETPQADDISGITYLYGIPGVAPVNDNFAQATPIVFTGNSVDISGTNVRATTEAGEPSPTGPGGRSVWWKWTPATTGRVAISTFGSDFDTRVTIATGGSVSTAALGASNDDDVNGPAELSSATTFVANAGTTYYIVVDGVQKTMGRIALTLVLGQFTVPLQIYEPYSFRTYAGADGSVGSADGAGQAARFNSPARVAVGPDGNIYVADYANGTIRKITPAGVVSTFVGVVGEPDHIDGPRETARIFPDGLAFGPDGTLYVAESSFQTIRKVTPAGYVTTFAGADRQIGSADGPGASARFYFPSAITIDGSGNLYVAELLNATIRKITPAGIVSTVAGRAGVQGVADGLGTAATFSYPNGIAATADGTLYVGDFVNGSIRKITPAGVVSTFAGLSVPFGSENYDGLGTAARFAGLLGLQMDASGNLFVTEIYDLIRKITPAGEVTTIAGKFGADGGDDGTAFNARFCQPSDVAIDPSGNLYIADRKNNSIRKMMPSGVVSTLAGKSMVGGTDGALADARFADVRGIEFDSAGNLILANTSGYTVRKISAGGQVSTIAGQAGEYGYTDGPNGVSRLFDPADVATAPGNIVYIAERFAHTIRKIDAAGNVVPFAGNFLTAGYTNGPAGTALFNLPISIASDPAGNVYVVESQSCAIRKIAPDGTTSTFAGSITEAGSADGVGTAARFMRPTAVTVGSDGSIYVADGGAFTVRKITASGVVSTVAGVPGQAGHVDRPGVHARFNGPNDVAVDDNGNIFVLDSNVIRKITPNGRVTTVSPFTFERDQVGRINFAVNRAGTQIYISAFNRGTIERGDLGPTIPYIQSQPEPYQIVGSGSTLTLSVNIAGSGSYQWYRDGVLIPGATQLS
ncbi:MAG: repeat containing protein, partial [Verrucomicrobia bacterium]|nr:repeat containing protein [Verrucomicrobiota bacterium]